MACEPGSGQIGGPRGVLTLSDLIDDGDPADGGRQIVQEQWALFEVDLRLDSTDRCL